MSLQESDMPARLAAAKAAAEEIGRDPDDAERQDPVRLFMAQVYRIGLAVHRDTGLYDTPELLSFLAESGRQLAGARAPLQEFISTLEDSLYGTWEGDWRYTCKVRSSIAFLFELYAETALADTLAQLDYEDLDRVMRNLTRKESFFSADDIPAGIPHSHWWWYGLPPNSADEENG